MRSSWQTRTLAELSEDVAYGYTESAVAEKVGPHFLRITDIQNGIVDWDTVPFCTIKPRDHAKYKLSDGDIVIARTGNSTGENFLYRGSNDAVFASYLIRFRIDSSIADPAYVWYNLRSPQWWSYVAGARTGSAQAGANAKVLGNFEIKLPPLHEQRAIARILGSLDDKIELNRRMNRTLEAMARALFKSWFVDFDPVHANAAGTPILPPDLAALFPAEFEPSELGNIPKGWAVKTLDDVADVGIGRTPPRKEKIWFTVPPNGVRWASIRDLGNAGAFITETAESLTDAAVAQHLIKQVPDGTILLSFKLTVGRVAITDGEMLTNEAIAHLPLKVDTPFDTSFLYCYLKNFDFGILGNTSSIATAVNSKSIRSIPVIVPPRGICVAFMQKTKPIFRKVRSLQHESGTLAALRDLLLPMLLSGNMQLPPSISSE